ncbi:MAG: hypothetical protein ACREDH_05205, partial [Methylocella sp.]
MAALRMAASLRRKIYADPREGGGPAPHEESGASPPSTMPAGPERLRHLLSAPNHRATSRKQ